uniref:Uncharacterized protein n=1 Tax=Anguilla anguilla TaxID=7936 RepID=A0A0E9SVV6_ANGAN
MKDTLDHRYFFTALTK